MKNHNRILTYLTQVLFNPECENSSLEFRNDDNRLCTLDIDQNTWDILVSVYDDPTDDTPGDGGGAVMMPTREWLEENDDDNNTYTDKDTVDYITDDATLDEVLEYLKGKVEFINELANTY